MKKGVTLSSGNVIDSIGLGTWKSERPKEAYNAVRSAIDLGYRHFDCASGYGNEAEIGAALQDAIVAGDVQRSDLFITSKLWNAHHYPNDVRPALERSLADLKLDYLDLYLMHWPVAIKPHVGFPEKGDDFISLENLPIEVTWAAMEQAVTLGLVKDLGVSNFSIKKLQALQKAATIPPVMNQVELHPYLQQNALVEYCQSQRIVVTAYAPLGSGDRPAMLCKSNEPTLMDHPVVQSIAQAHQVTPAQILIAWSLHRSNVVIPKSSSPARQALNLEARNIVLTSEDMLQLSRLDLHYRYLDGSFWVMPESPYTLENLWDE
ncbi:aldo/keto reductase [Vibrio sp. SM6]|uniref:Aldo/keto reductase n=1 Tax=Vibrio agarilyticus TaxID=2726741 RepID=A0A7X8YFV2_9VIBR|nr:aldo/keto reductase [Vibrio agarilyticus]NLS11726.1 aldo/keto reductase [Vibrio agarilyticus]